MDIVEIGKYLEQRRRQINLRQEDLSEMSGITVKTIYNIEEGKGNPSLKTLNKLCEVLGVEVSIDIKKVS
ncbi:MAG: helix-turn-helix transcriptional regulator [Bacteroidota bacterium]